MPIENRNLEPGTRLVARYKKEDRTCEVVETPDGLRYRLDNGTEHKSPSSAGKAATAARISWRSSSGTPAAGSSSSNMRGRQAIATAISSRRCLP